MDLSEIIVQFASVCLSAVILLVRNAVIAIELSYSTFPQATMIVCGLFLMYFVYKTIKRMVRMVINLAISMVKTFLLLVIIIIGMCLYLRGWKFITQDVPYIKKIVFLGEKTTMYGTSKGTGVIDAMFRLLNISVSPQLKSFPRSILEDLGITFSDEQVADAFNPHEDLSYEEVEGFVNLKMGYIGNYINEQNIHQLGNEFMNLWANNN